MLPDAPCRVLDVGCGSGAFTFMLKDEGFDAVGVDWSLRDLDNSRSDVCFYVMDAHDLKFADASFDCVALLEVLEHLENPVKALKEMYRVLKPGGCLIVSTPNAHDPLRFFKGWGAHLLGMVPGICRKIGAEERNTGTEKDHIWLWDLWNLYRLLNRCGFKYRGHAFCNWGGTVLIKVIKA